jgi:hypothetical protein
MKMHMSSSEIEQDAMEVEYGEEIMSAGWNPAVEKVCELLLGSPTEASLNTPATKAAMKCLR